MLGTEVQGGTKTKVPLILGLQSVNVSQFVKQGTRLVKVNLGETQRFNDFPPFLVPGESGFSRLSNEIIRRGYALVHSSFKSVYCIWYCVSYN